MDKQQEIEELEKWLVGHKDIPYIQREETLMDVLGIQTLENPWSCIYAFFLDERENHNLGDRFIRTLEKLMKEEKGWITPTEIRIEHTTDNNNRIDILIKDETNKRAIIIENKVKHHPKGNPFSDYIKEVQKNCKDIRVVILSLHKISKKVEDKSELKDIKNLTEKVRYFNITHEEYITEIEKELPPNDNSLYRQILNHFIINIKKLTNMVTSEEINFFLSHFETIRKIYKLYSNVKDNYLKNIVVENDTVKVEKKLYTHKDVSWDDVSWIYMKYKKNPSLRLTIFFYPTTLRVILEMFGKKEIGQINRFDIQRYAERINNAPECKGNGITMVPLTKENINDNFLHIAEYSIPVTSDDLKSSQLQNTLESIIDSPIYNLGLRILDYLQTK